MTPGVFRVDKFAVRIAIYILMASSGKTVTLISTVSYHGWGLTCASDNTLRTFVGADFRMCRALRWWIPMDQHSEHEPISSSPQRW